jgi:5-methylcytosine-specific restriction protein A
MAREVPLWVGNNDDSAIPDRVKLRIYLNAQGRCTECTRRVGVGTPYEIDHKIALINGGKHAEDNLCLLCQECHKQKTATDVTEKARTYRKRKSHYGIRKAKGRPIPGSKASGWKRTFSGEWIKRDEKIE